MSQPGAKLGLAPLVLLALVTLLAQAQNDFDVRITPIGAPPDHPNEKMGVVGVFYAGQWGTICATDQWQFKEAAVACRKALDDYSFVLYKGWQQDGGNASSTVWLRNITCTGHEADFDQCDGQNKWVDQDCPSGKAAGVACYEVPTLKNDTSLTPYMGDSLGNMYTAFEGNAYFALDPSISIDLAICGTNWNEQDAAVFCRQANNRTLYRTYTNSFFGAHNPSAGDVVVVPFPVDFVCDGTEASLLDCPSQSSNKNGICYEGRDASLACLFREEPADFTVRLVGSSDINVGRVEVRYQGTWGSVGGLAPGDERTLEYGDVVCRMLDLGYATEVNPYEEEVGLSQLPVVAAEVDCTGAEPSLAQCGEDLEFVDDVFRNMTRDDTVVHCSGKIDKNSEPIKLNLQKSNKDFAAMGFLVQFTDQRWHSQCAIDWTLQNTQVACRELGYGPPKKAMEITYDNSLNGPMSTYIYKCQGTEAMLYQCNRIVRSQQTCKHKIHDVYIGCSHPFDQYEVRINPDLGTISSGPVEVFYDGEWGSICTDQWGVHDAFVACRQLGFNWVEEQGWDHDLGSLTGKKWLNEMECVGNETSLHLCPSDIYAFYDHDCDSTASVDCGSLSGYSDAEALLQDGLGDEDISSEGTAYLQISPSERVVICDHSWNLNAANAFCRQMGKNSALRVTMGSYYGRHPQNNGLFPVRKWNMAFECTGHESSLTDCVTYAKPEGDCPDGRDAGVVCLERVAPEDFGIKLVGGETAWEGRVEVCYEGTCGSLGKDNNLENPADFGDVVCRELNLGYAVEVSTDGRYGAGKELLKMNQIWCAGSEESLAQCGPHIEWLDSPDASLRDELTGVKCSGPIDAAKSPIRFSQLNDKSGIVEIFHQGRFGTICNKGWTLANAQVVCRELGFGPPLEAQLGLDGYKGPIFLQDVQCRGTEQTLDQCQHSEWSAHTCEHSLDVSVLCQREQPIPSTPAPTTDGGSRPLGSVAMTLLTFSLAAAVRFAL